MGCRYHQFWELPGSLPKYLKMTDAQIMKIISSLNPSCFWDYFEVREHTLEEIGAYLGGVSRERIRQWLDGGDHVPGILEKLRKT
jgi:DNA-directed RNA polymerase sigma subunit (sigma70/sigma32)